MMAISFYILMKSIKRNFTEMIPEGTVIWLMSLCSLGSIIVVMFGCVCGCRKKVHKNELMGLAGMVKLTNPDENINFDCTIPAVQLNSVAVTSAELAQEMIDSNKRQTTGFGTATRSLPDLPVESSHPLGSGDSAWGNNDPNDTSSDLYATVEENKIDGRTGNKKIPSGLTVDSTYGSPSQTEDSLSPYARLKGEHPYDQLKQNEHPYAQLRANGIPAGLKNNQSGDASCISTTSSSSRDSISQDQGESPIAPPRTRKSLALSQSSLPGLDGSSIPAATAIAGGIPANQELPYMTPPINLSSGVGSVASSSVGPLNQPQHFSGDSQDSSKGYTSISVREPLSNILGERALVRRQELIDSHYTTMSDDSDEMYAAIEEPNQTVYTSGSETYAQIRTARPTLATIEDSEHTTSSSNLVSSLKNDHSRQASSSSAASSGICPNSPKPEKRQANSPLPRPPDPSTPGTSAQGIDDMYAKVIKKRRSSQSISSVDHEIEEPTSIGYETLNNSSSSDPNHDSLIPGYERVSNLIIHAEPNYEELKPQDSLPNSLKACYATVTKSPHNHTSRLEPDYASLSRKIPSLGYDPNYESVCTGSNSDPNYESLEQHDEPPYEKLQSASDDTSPDYETVYKVSGSELYSKVNKHSNS